MKTALELLSLRYTTKAYSPDKTVPDELIEDLLQSLRLAPSSINSQPWHFISISNAADKLEISQASWATNKQKVIDCSHAIVLCSKQSFTVQDCAEIESLSAKLRHSQVNPDRLEMMQGFVSSKSAADLQTWIDCQLYLALGQLLTTAAMIGVDATPMEGFDPEAVGELFNLKEQGLKATAIVLLGYRSDDDFNTLDKACKVRFPYDQVVTCRK
ncbi:nitroreductase/dihydropteridine reductase [Sinobacterium caligoides]|uniref:Nitroreductase/dihydropteridine reductase n=1 Tax=Sinobacterium caligoides TaxID=933926 RepID=A0A3N2DXG9_9GAMM|nr:nitroreductase family protein [Sinobacterium caligoides]ROS04550.1 nitroreductase/dihydropteridine reductase [Sinobacterium caligoides]